MDDAVQSALQDLQQRFAGDGFAARGFLVVFAELALEQA